MPGFRTDVRMPASQSTLSSTATALGSVTIPAVTNGTINITGFWLYYTTPFTVITPQPKILSGSTTIFQMPAITSSTAVTLFQPISGFQGTAVTVQATCSAAAQTIEVGALYYVDY